jgi:anti-sigma B factor antagonist
MRIDVRLVSNRAVVLLLDGDLKRGDDLRLLREKVDTLLRDGYREFVVDLSSVSYVDSAGLDELVKVVSSVKAQSGVLRVEGLTSRIADLMALRKLGSLFDAQPPGPTADPWHPWLRDSRWELQVGVAFGILLLIGLMIVMR